MGFFLILFGSILGVVISRKLLKKELPTGEFYVYLIVGLIVLTTLSGVFGPFRYYKIDYIDYNIKSIKTSNSIYGNFVLGTGKIQSIDSYIAYVELDSNSYKRMSFPTKSTVIIESESSPMVHELIKHVHSHMVDFLLYPLKLESWAKTSYIISVPPATIIQEFKLD